MKTINPVISAFWNWFIDHEKQYLDDQSPDFETKLDELLMKIQEYSTAVFFEIFADTNGDSVLVFTTDGNKEAFPVVDKLVSYAPQISGWTFCALKPPMQREFVIHLDNVKIDTNELVFESLKSTVSSDRMGLRIFFKKYNPVHHEELMFGVQLMLRTILGERSAAHDISHIEVQKLPSGRRDLTAIKNLPEYLLMYKSMK